jgi:hypothetical protein
VKRCSKAAMYYCRARRSDGNREISVCHEIYGAEEE